MSARAYRCMLMILLGLTLVACSAPGGAGSPPTASATAVSTGAAVGTIQVSGIVGTPSPQQAQAVATITTLLRSYNAGELDAVLALVSDDVRWADCDYTQQPPVARALDGKAALAEWLQWRFGERDRLAADRIVVNGDGMTMGLGVGYERRTSDTLRALGHAEGIVPGGMTKVTFDYNPSTRTGERRPGPPHGLVTFFINASDGSGAASCQIPVTTS